jgi:hypothetical protein
MVSGVMKENKQKKLCLFAEKEKVEKIKIFYVSGEKEGWKELISL